MSDEAVSPEALHEAQYSEPKRGGSYVAGRVVPTRTLLRLVELAQAVRDPTNSAPLTELLDLIEETADA